MITAQSLLSGLAQEMYPEYTVESFTKPDEDYCIKLEQDFDEVISTNKEVAELVGDMIDVAIGSSVAALESIKSKLGTYTVESSAINVSGIIDTIMRFISKLVKTLGLWVKDIVKGYSRSEARIANALRVVDRTEAADRSDIRITDVDYAFVNALVNVNGKTVTFLSPQEFSSNGAALLNLYLAHQRLTTEYIADVAALAMSKRWTGLTELSASYKEKLKVILGASMHDGVHALVLTSMVKVLYEESEPIGRLVHYNKADATLANVAMSLPLDEVKGFLIAGLGLIRSASTLLRTFESDTAASKAMETFKADILTAVTKHNVSSEEARDAFESAQTAVADFIYSRKQIIKLIENQINNATYLASKLPVQAA